MAQKDSNWIREATPEEIERMIGWVRWSYDRHLPVVYYPRDNVITVVPVGKSLDGLVVHILQKGIIDGKGIQSSAGEAAAGEREG